MGVVFAFYFQCSKEKKFTSGFDLLTVRVEMIADQLFYATVWQRRNRNVRAIGVRLICVI